MYHTAGDFIIFTYKYAQSLIYIVAGLVVVAINNKIVLVPELRKKKATEAYLIIQKTQLYIVGLFSATYLALQFLPKNIDQVFSGIACLKEMVLYVLLVCIIVGVICIVFDAILKKSLEVSLSLWTIFIICIIQIMLLGKPVIEDWASTYYVLDYSMGFGSRMFMGTLLRLFYKDYLYNDVATRFVMFFLLLFTFLCSYMMACCVAKVESKSKKGMYFLIAIVLASPGSIQAVAENYGRLEMYGYITTLLAVALYIICENSWIKIIGLNLLNIVMMLIYQGNIFLVFPIIFGILLFDAFDGKWKVKETIFGVLSVVILCISFLITQFYNPAFEKYDERVIKEYVKAKTDMDCATGPLVNEYYKPLKEVWTDLNLHYFLHDGSDPSRFHPWISTALTAVLVMPLIVLSIVFWKKQWRVYKEEGFGFWKNPISWICLSFLAIVPDMLLNIDWGRWFLAIVFVQVVLVFYMIYKDLGSARELLSGISEWVQRHTGIATCFVVYLALLGNFYDCSFLNIVQDFVGLSFGVS